MLTIEEYLQNIDYDEFISNRKKLLRDGIVRQIEIIGEATKNLSDNMRKKYPDIPWKDMAGMRDKLIHSYFGVDFDAVWETAENDIPTLKGKIQNIIKAEEDNV
ncbi:MAG: DUF86 domain-containing protein [Nanoarchaeota archaeon]|nr:DUF86 domain-containing protein [Nanoarchaeota archaeon]